MARLLIVDDEQSICWGLAKLAEKMGHTAATAASAEEALAAADSPRPDAIILDIRLPGMDGISAMPRLREKFGAEVPIILITAFGQLETAVEAVRQGAFDYLVKPFDLKVAQRAIERALHVRDTTVREVPKSFADDAEVRIVGRSAAIQGVFREIALVAPSEACVHIRGDSGTGKELVARAIHRYSRRSEGPFIPVHVASLSPTLAESELFGHVKGAFTGADHDRRGMLEQSGGGTIFFDEVADIPLSLQVKLLRALEQGEVWPVGADRPIQSDFRLVSATHQDLRRRVATGEFRHDLFFRLITFEIDIPPLRERAGDIAELSEHFLDVLAARDSSPRPTVSPEALAELEKRPWHGNVRELRNTIERAMIVARGGVLSVEHLPPPAPAPTTEAATPEAAITELLRAWAEAQFATADEATDLYNRLLTLVEPPFLSAALSAHHNQVAAAARKVGLHRTTLKKKIDQYGLGDS